MIGFRGKHNDAMEQQNAFPRYSACSSLPLGVVHDNLTHRDSPRKYEIEHGKLSLESV